MPLARIITPGAVDNSGIAERLRARGYTVEVVRPEQVHISPADLEIDLQTCSAEQALLRAAEAAGLSGAEEIYVDPAAVTPEALAASRNLAARERSQAGAGGISATLREKQAQLTHWWEEHFHRGERKPLTIIDSDSEPEVYAAKRVDTVFAGSNADELRQQMEQARQAAEAERVQRAEAERIQRAEAARRRLEEAAAERARQQEQTAQLAREAEAQRARQEQEAAQLAREAEMEAVRQQQEQARLARESQLQRERDRQAAEMRERLLREAEERRRDEQAAEAARAEQERKQADEAARVAAFAEQSMASATASVPPAWRPVENASAGPVQRPRAGQRLRQREREWRLAFVAAVVFSAILVVGWSAVTNRKAAAPLSNSELNKASDIKQQVPFGPATLGPGNTAAPAPKPQQPSVSVDAMVPVPHAPATAQKPSAVTPKRAPKRAHKRVRRTAEDDQDVVVRHFGAPAPKAKTDMNAGLKRYSDLE